MRTLSRPLIVLSFLVAGCAGQKEYPGEHTDNDEVLSPTGLRYITLAEGEGEEAHDGMTVSVHYTGYLMDGKKFDSSYDRDEPIRFVLGSGRVIRGWEEGLMGMKVNEKRKLIIPPQLGYGERGVPGVIPPQADLVFDVQLVSVSMPNQ
jgi:FKBP-type peptidyl-prolyl cis-trans isomerase